MRKSESGGVKKLPPKRRELDFADRDLRCCAIECVSDERMLERGKVYPDLMRSAGVQLDLD